MTKWRLTEDAKQDMKDIREYTQDRFGRKQASSYTDTLITTFDSLARFPLSGESCEEVNEARGVKDAYRRLRVAHHTIYYRPIDFGAPNDGILIVRILHDRRDQTGQLH